MNDVQLIRKILSGDDAAFSALVQKYEKSVHAFAWREIGDYHFAEEITQDTFIQVYKNLATLRNPNLFAGWLHVIAKRLCIKWNQKRRPTFQSLEEIPMEEIDEHSYNTYTSEQHETQAIENRLERVKKLLEKLPESERTVMTLYYLGEMTTREISKFLGVSVNTIKSRLRRARMRLQEENPQPLEILSTVKFTTSLTESIMQQVADIKQAPTPTVKPSPPWAVFGSAAAILIMAIIGLSNHHLFSFQEPYSLDAQSEPKIEIVDAPTLFDTHIKRTAQNQLTRIGAVVIAQEGTETETKKKTPVNLDFDAILEGIKQNDEKVKSGEGRTVFTYESFTELGDLKESRTLKTHLIFDEHQNRVRMRLAESVSLQRILIPRTILIVTEKGTFRIELLRIDHKPRYGFEKRNNLPLIRHYYAPRRWARISDTEDLATSLKKLNYQILTREMLDGIPCYVLEGKKEPPPGAEQQMPEVSRIWIAPEHGFRIQKRERRWTTKEDTVDGGVEKGTPFVARNTFSYQQIGDVWLLKSTKWETWRIDADGKEHIIVRMTLELQDFKINHAVPAETFVIDIPDDAKITVDGFDERMSKQEFFEWYGQQ
ncbi:MAG: RNA polymerase sigma factor [Candidatus Poribacteria bacterium]|nr:RNA polymerase sigma factor [Candidatus Poribacteria bacterium]